MNTGELKVNEGETRTGESRGEVRECIFPGSRSDEGNNRLRLRS